MDQQFRSVLQEQKEKFVGSSRPNTSWNSELSLDLTGLAKLWCSMGIKGVKKVIRVTAKRNKDKVIILVVCVNDIIVIRFAWRNRKSFMQNQMITY